MSVQIIELEIVEMNIVSDEAFEATVNSEAGGYTGYGWMCGTRS